MLLTKQALVTCGGTGYRLKQKGIKFPLSKSFLELEGHPMLYWCLQGLHKAGIERLVIVGDGNEKLKKAETVLHSFPYSFAQVDFFEDPGLGSNGLPFQTINLLEDQFFFECGHSMSEAEHYSIMEQHKKPNTIVLSSFKPNPYAPRPHVRINKERITPIMKLFGTYNEFSIGSPRLLDSEYALKLPELDFDLYKIIQFYSSRDALKLVQSNLPIEVDVVEELEEAIPAYRRQIKKQGYK